MNTVLRDDAEPADPKAYSLLWKAIRFILNEKNDNPALGYVMYRLSAKGLFWKLMRKLRLGGFDRCRCCGDKLSYSASSDFIICDRCVSAQWNRPAGQDFWVARKLIK
jgi:hypothetical protein